MNFNIFRSNSSTENSNIKITTNKSNNITYLKSLKDGVTELPPFLTRHIVIGIKSLALPILLSRTPDQIPLYSAIKPWDEYIISFGDENLSAIFLCINANPTKYPERIGIFFKQGLVYNLIISALVNLMTYTIPYFLKIINTPIDLAEQTHQIIWLLMLNNTSAVTMTYLVHFMNAIDIVKFNVLIQIFNCILDLSISYILINQNYSGYCGLASCLLASLISNCICSLIILINLGFNKHYHHYELFHINNTYYYKLFLLDMLKTGIPRGITSLITKAGSLVVTSAMSQSKQNLKAITTPEQYKKILETLSKASHKAYIKLTGTAYANNNILKAIKYCTTGLILLPGYMTLALFSYLLFGKYFIASTNIGATNYNSSHNNHTITDNPIDFNMQTLAFNLLIIKGLVDIIYFAHEGAEIWFTACKKTIIPMLTLLFATLATILSVVLFKQYDNTPEAIYASPILGTLPATLLLFILVKKHQYATMRQGPERLLNFLSYNNEQAYLLEDNNKHEYHDGYGAVNI